MGPDEEPKPEAAQSEAAGPRANPRRDRRPGRGRRGRGRGRGSRPKPPQESPAELVDSGTEVAGVEQEAIFELAEESRTETGSVATPDDAVTSLAPEPVSAPSVSTPSQPASQANVEQAIEEVSSVINVLREALDDMEEVLEMLEVFERQKNADEREIDSLRRALRQVHRPREGGHHPHR